ncbi:MAG: TonB-dependent receptor [Caulobacteraceae bacterium]|nr:TonB-dependent receptor [Caulobacteraceae bacterium]
MNKHLLISSAIAAIALAGGAQAATTTSAANAAGASADQATTVTDVVVTAQRKEENLQTTPVQVSAFPQSALSARRLDSGENLEIAIPNVNYSRTNYSGFSLEIRGVGSQSVGAAEQGVSINENFVSVQNNHFPDAQFFDTERVEVVRGPQSVLYGRSATAGALNVITATPTSTLGAELTAEVGDYNEAKLNGFVNIPLGDMFSLRLAGIDLSRGGVGTNLVTGQKVDGRNLWSTRATLSFKPNDRFHAYLMYEHFNEDDTRNLIGKQLCTSDPGPTHVGPVALSSTEQGFLSQGCQNASLYTPAAHGLTNTSADLAGIYAQELGLLAGNGAAGHPLQNDNLHDIASPVNPLFQARQDFVNLNIAWDITDSLRLESLSGYNYDKYLFRQDYNRFVANVPFGASPAAACLFCLAVPGYSAIYRTLFPGGVVTDGQTGNTNALRVFNQGDGWAREWTQELRLTSSFKGPLNFSVGGLYYREAGVDRYFVFFNSLTALEQVFNFAAPGTFGIDQHNPPTGAGHNYYLSDSRKTTQSYAGFGEVYYDITPELKLTLGVRATVDDKAYFPFQNPLGVPGSGLSPLASSATSTLATTGRAVLEWTPQVPFTDRTMIYGSYARGYKAGGFNTPCQGATPTAASCGFPLSYAPEYVNAFEIGTKNTLDGGRLTLNLAGFFYDYNGYQISTIIDQASINQNVNAQIYGVEWESAWSPVRNLTFNAGVGYLHTRITSGVVLDQMNLTQGDPGLVLVKAGENGENCVVNAVGLAKLVTAISAAPQGAQASEIVGSPLPGGSHGICGGSSASNVGQYGLTANFGLKGPYASSQSSATDPLGLYNYAGHNVLVNANGVGQGVPGSLTGKQLPNAPAWTVSVGAQYVWELPSEWTATLRGDFYWQDYSYARIFNDAVDYLKAWDNVNATLTFANAPYGLTLQFYVKNALNSQPITSTFVSDPAAGLFANTFTLDPRTFGVAFTKRF